MAYGQANKTLYEAEAIADTLVGVTKSIGDAIKEMKDTLQFGNEDVLEYMKYNWAAINDCTRKSVICLITRLSQ